MVYNQCSEARRKPVISEEARHALLYMHEISQFSQHSAHTCHVLLTQGLSIRLKISQNRQDLFIYSFFFGRSRGSGREREKNKGKKRENPDAGSLVSLPEGLGGLHENQVDGQELRTPSVSPM